MFACSLEPLKASIPPQKGTNIQVKSGYKTGSPKEEEDGVIEEKVVWTSTPLRTSAGSQHSSNPLCCSVLRGHISADESKSLFEVVLRLYPYILHLVIEGPESEVGAWRSGTGDEMRWTTG